MADNLTVTQGSGTTIAADDVSGVLYQRVKLSQGADGAATDVSSASPLQVTGVNGTFPVTSTTLLTETDFDTKTGSLTETAPATDTASSGINGRLQRIAQRITSLITALGSPFQAGGSIGNTSFGATQSGIWTVQPGNTANTTAWKVDGSAVTQPVSIATNTPLGNVAHDAVDSGAPIKTGGRARTSEITAVANDDRVDSVHDSTGKQIVLPYAVSENSTIGTITTAMTGTTSTAVSGMGAPGAGLRNYITTIIISNAHATVGTDVILQDGSGGTTVGTFPAAAVYGGVAIALPKPIRQPTTNTGIFAANITTGASTKVTCYGYIGV